MRKFFKICVLVFFLVIFIVAIIFSSVFLTPSKIEFCSEKLDNTSDFINFYDKQNNLITTKTNGNYLPEKPIPTHVKNAFVAIEDKNFYVHNGIDIKRMIKACFVNLKKRSFSQGASTISQQLIKNTHLSNDKTISRKIDEIKLTFKLESKYTKDEIITMYLNTIYFGENSFGIVSASKKYFNKSPDELSVAEGATLAAIVQAPSKLNPISNLENCIKRRNLVLKRMWELGYISQIEFDKYSNETIEIAVKEDEIYQPYLKACITELENECNITPYALKNCKIITYYDEEFQKTIYDNQIEEHDFQGIIIDNESCGILGYVSTCGEIEREIASTAKPILVYGPAIDKGIINELTVIKDEKVSFGDYSPQNFNDEYYGNVSVKFAISKSLNVPCVKILNSLGVKTAKEYSNKLNIKASNDGLSLALGNLGNGIAFKNLVGAYTSFANFGDYKKPRFIRQIIDTNGKVIYSEDTAITKVYQPSSATLINDMLLDCSKTGTAKKLSYLNFDICSKTGTNGTKNGNIDSYSIAYTTKHTFGIWNGNADNSPMPNECTGSNAPTYVLGKICDKVYENVKPSNFTKKEVSECLIDKISYDSDGSILLADINTPDKYVVRAIFPNSQLPKDTSDRFIAMSNFEYELKLDENLLTISYSLPDYAEIEIYKNFNNQKISVFKGRENYSEQLIDEGIYIYSVFLTINGKTPIICDEIILSQVLYNKKIDGTTSVETPDNWWVID